MPDGPVGAVVTAPIWFTDCVDKSKYHNVPDLGWTIGPGIVGKEACAYLLGGKLVCLDGTQCAIGTIIHIEPVGYHKSGFDLIDNDFCINVLLFPHEVDEFGPVTGPTGKLDNWDWVRNDGIQGVLIDHDPAALPTPREPSGVPTPYTVTYLFGVADGPAPYEPHEDKTEAKLEEVKQDAAGISRIEIPVLHCEFEGSRIFAVCSAIAPLLDLLTGGPGAGACRKTVGRIPFIGGFVCTVVEWVATAALAPVIAAVAAAAWAAAGISDELFLTGPISRQVELGEHVIVTGRWVWDGGHSGWNELHPTFTLQRIVLPEKTTAGFSDGEARDFVDRWCRLKAEVPPRHGTAAAGLVQKTPEQAEVHGRQQAAENRWEIHPTIDGCAPSEEGEEPEPPVVH